MADILLLTLRAFMFFKSIPTSFVTPSPNLKLEAATYVQLYNLSNVYYTETYGQESPQRHTLSEHAPLASRIFSFD
jgi:hypothetical protein